MARKPDEIELQIERGNYPRHVTLRTLYGGMAAADILGIPKFKADNRALAVMLSVMRVRADKAHGLIGKAIAAAEILDVPLDALYDELAKVDPAMPDDAARVADTLERIAAEIAYLYEYRKRAEKKPRIDKGKKHTKRKYADGWRKQEEVAADFDKARFIPEKGAKPKGGCTLSKIKQWDAAYPNTTHAQPICGYYAELRINRDLKSEYWDAVLAWNEYWQGWRKAFKGWRETHKANPIGEFRYRRAKIISGYCPDLIGMDADGKQYGAPDGKKKPRKA